MSLVPIHIIYTANLFLAWKSTCKDKSNERAINSAIAVRTKLVYVLNRNTEGKLYPSSPLEAHKNHTLVTHVVGVDQVGFGLDMRKSKKAKII